MFWSSAVGALNPKPGAGFAEKIGGWGFEELPAVDCSLNRRRRTVSCC